MVLTWSEATKPMELKPEESSVMICWVMTVDPIAASAVRNTFYHVLFLSKLARGNICAPHSCGQQCQHHSHLHADYSWLLNREFTSISHTVGVMSSVPNEVNPLIAQHGLGLLLVLKMRTLFAFIFTVGRKQDLLDWTSERVLNWHSWFSWLEGVTTPPAHSPAYVQIVKQNLVKKRWWMSLHVTFLFPIHFSPGERCCHCMRKKAWFMP